MGFSFYIEDGLGNIVDEHGNDPMEITENEDPFKLEELSSYSTYVALRTRMVLLIFSRVVHSSNVYR